MKPLLRDIGIGAIGGGYIFSLVAPWILANAIVAARAEAPMTKQEQKTQLEAQTSEAVRRTKIRYINSAMRRTEQPDDVFLDHGREDVRSLGVDLLQCFKTVDEKEKELEGIKKVLLERRP